MDYVESYIYMEALSSLFSYDQRTILQNVAFPITMIVCIIEM